ncbi:nucleolar complex-associated protein-domain-containing protein [Hysterangium stoloniferum]|nr:nucleolar complex-associated protein-domain-containing protein [Hysterangium stoloniferum]
MPHKVVRSAISGPLKRTKKMPDTASKRRKLSSGKATPSSSKGKQRAYERTNIPLPDIPDDEGDDAISDQDIEFFKDDPSTGNFLQNLDQNGISRSKKETQRLHVLSKPPRERPKTDDLPSLDSHDEDEDTWSDALDNINSDASDDNLDDLSFTGPEEFDSDAEQPYERDSRRGASWKEARAETVSRLPIKLPNGKIVQTGGRVIPTADSESEHESVVSRKQQPPQIHVEDVSTGARFGRLAVSSVISTSSRQLRIQMAKEQIAGICQDILAEPESSLQLLRRLHSFSLSHITTPQSPTPIPNDPLIRRLAMISQLAVLKDVIPGYRIRPLTDAEKSEKVSQMVAKTREWEQGLVGVYQTYLRGLEGELKGKTEFAELALKSMCTLLTEATHFNFRTNLISALVMQLSKKSWDNSSDICLRALISVFKEDGTGLPSLEIVRLLNRMVKERKFAVHPNALSCLAHLRLKSELGGVRASETNAYNEDAVKAKRESRRKAGRQRAKGKKVDLPHISKKGLKALKEKKEIEGQMQEAEAEVDREEKANMQTETLKLLFVLYFRILKAPNWTPLLIAALEGLSRYAHMVNIDFFKDLMQILKELISRPVEDMASQTADSAESTDPMIRHRLLCIVTAFELLTGQGEALNIDLRDFINHLYALILPISLQPNIEFAGARADNVAIGSSTSDLLFRALGLAFPVRSAGSRSPVRTAAFAKRVLVASLSFPVATTLRALEFVRQLLVNEPKLQALLSTEDRATDGLYQADLDDPELSNPFGTSFWELAHLTEVHWDHRVRDKAQQLSAFAGI